MSEIGKRERGGHTKEGGEGRAGLWLHNGDPVGKGPGNYSSGDSLT